MEWETKELKNGIDRYDRIEKKNKTLGTERCENVDTLYINNTQLALSGVMVAIIAFVAPVNKAKKYLNV